MQKSGVRLVNQGWPSWEQCSQDGPFVKKHKLFYNYANITIKVVKF